MLTPASPAPCAHPHAHADPTSTNMLKDPSLHMMQPAGNKFLQELQGALTHKVKPVGCRAQHRLCVPLGDGAGKAPGHHLDFRVTEAREDSFSTATVPRKTKSQRVPGAQCLQVICSRMVPSSQA